jgi:SAM-dependent methyltransferase
VSFYDDLAPYYHLLFEDWEASVARQGAALARLLAGFAVVPGDTVLDAACGIGTQTIGLLDHGYRVIASDISADAVARLRGEIQRRGLSAEIRIDDMRTLTLAAADSVAALIACDNSIPHLLSDDEIRQALQCFFRRVRPGGVVVVSVRDYAAMERRNPDVRPYGVRIDRQGNRFLAVQVWEWEGDQYDLRMYLTFEAQSGACETRVLVTRYYAIAVSRLMELMVQAGFADVRRHDDVLFQPVLTGMRLK